ncbi:MAG: S8 family serine peptidase [Endomicrobia bacterium]|nr:S8 family serine peptidase [Endomicrobiia bacterium]
MKKKFSFILLLIFLFSNALFAQSGGPQISESLLKRASQVKSIAKAKAVPEEKIGVIFYPQDGNSDNADVSFFQSRAIEYIKSRNFLSAKVSADMIPLLGNIKGVERIDLDIKIKPRVVSEGRDAVNATPYYYNNIRGAGIKIAVIDVGFAQYSSLQSKGELPLTLITKDFTIPGQPPVNASSETEKHGSACAEIVYDFVPDSQMYLLKVNNSTTLQNAFTYCKSEGIRVVSGSIGFDSGFWCDGTGDFAQMATDAYNNGVLPVFAAGNEAQQSWFGMFTGDAGNWMIFPGGKDYLELNIIASGEVAMMWDDFTARNKKYTMYMYDSASNALLDSSAWSTGNTPSVYVSNGFYSRKVKIKIQKENSYDDVNIRLYFDGSYVNASDIRSESSLSSPSDSREAVAVGAVNVTNWSNGPIEYYSSWGPTRKPSQPSTVLQEARKPDITGPTWVTTVSYGPRGFNGTSGATPHISGAAAVLLSLDSAMTVSQLKDKLLSYSSKIGTSPDNIYGSGKLVLGTESLPDPYVGEIVCYPNPSSISKNGHVKITNLPYSAPISINIYTVTGEFVKSFSQSDLQSKSGRLYIEWNLKNQNGSQIAPGVYFITINNTPFGKKVKKVAVIK